MKINFNGTNGKINFNGTNGVIHFGDPGRTVNPTLGEYFSNFSSGDMTMAVQLAITNNSQYSVNVWAAQNSSIVADSFQPITAGATANVILETPSTVTSTPRYYYVGVKSASQTVSETVKKYFPNILGPTSSDGAPQVMGSAWSKGCGTAGSISKTTTYIGASTSFDKIGDDVSIVTDSTVSLNGSTKLCIDWETNDASDVSIFYFGIGATHEAIATNLTASLTLAGENTRQTSILDVTAYNDSYYIHAHAKKPSTASNQYCGCTIYKIWTE